MAVRRKATRAAQWQWEDALQTLRSRNATKKEAVNFIHMSRGAPESEELQWGLRESHEILRHEQLSGKEVSVLLGGLQHQIAGPPQGYARGPRDASPSHEGGGPCPPLQRSSARHCD
eukprot:Hpha_TRINITY_DN6863_c0_g1::TRINITY_DN6863_c0_g1_i1::g.46116::m.46116